MKIKYKIVYGFVADREITIEANELEKAYGLFLSGNGRAIFNNGEAVDSRYIHSISEDWTDTMGWNKVYKLGPEDYEQIRSQGYEKYAKEEKARIKERVQYLLDNNRGSEIGRNVSIPKLGKENNPKEISHEVKQLADRMKI